MFSFTNDNSSTYDFPLSSSNSYPPLLHSHENIDIFGRNQDHISLLNDVLMAPESCFLNLGGGVIPSSDTVASLCGDYYYYQYQQQHHPYFASRDVTTVPEKVKKDRRSKICTAQGLRDRRVRLSINVAREFFDLQDLLGFDKPSKTLEWLLSNSRNAIRDLQRSSSMCNDDNAISHQLAPKDGQRMRKNMKKTAAIDHQLAMVKALRAKARGRARERTREKMCSSSRNRIISKTASPQILSHSSLSNYEILEPAADKNQESDSTLRTNHRESIVTKRKLKESSDQNLELISASKELTSWNCCCSHMNVQSPNIVGSQNWDMNNGGAFTCPGPRTYATSNNCNMNHNSSGF